MRLLSFWGQPCCLPNRGSLFLEGEEIGAGAHICGGVQGCIASPDTRGDDSPIMPSFRKLGIFQGKLIGELS